MTSPHPPSLVTRHALLDDVLATWQHALGRDATAYRGHVYRTFNFARALAPAEVDGGRVIPLRPQ